MSEKTVREKVKDWSKEKFEDSFMERVIAEARERGLHFSDPDLTFRKFVDQYFSLLNNGAEFIWNKHNEVIADVLEDVLAGRKRKVMIWLPPRTGKSVLVSNYFPAYWLLKHPHQFVGLASYNQDSAEGFSKIAKRAYLASGRELSKDSKAVGYWETGLGGGMWAAGVQSAQLGRGFSLGIIDDPIKNAAEAESEASLEGLYKWFDSTFFTRANLFTGTRAAMVIVQQRWSDNDLCGWLLSRPQPEDWHIVCLEAVKEEEPPRIPPNCTLEPDWRETGEYLFDSEDFIEKVEYQKKSSPFVYFAEYQQRPTMGVGEKVCKDDFQIIHRDKVPKLEQLVRAWDTQVSRSSRDWTVGVLMGIDEQNNIYILDIVRLKGDAGEVYERIVQQALIDGDEVVVAIEEVAISKQTVQELRREGRLGLHQFSPIKVDSSKGNLERRSAALFSRIRSSQIFLAEDEWNARYIDEFVRFSGSRNDTDDQISATNIGMAATFHSRGTTRESRRPPYLSPAWWALKKREEAAEQPRGLW